MKCDGIVYHKKLQHQTIFLEFIAKNKTSIVFTGQEKRTSFVNNIQ